MTNVVQFQIAAGPAIAETVPPARGGPDTQPDANRVSGPVYWQAIETLCHIPFVALMMIVGLILGVVLLISFPVQALIRLRKKATIAGRYNGDKSAYDRDVYFHRRRA